MFARPCAFAFFAALSFSLGLQPSLFRIALAKAGRKGKQSLTAFLDAQHLDIYHFDRVGGIPIIEMSIVEGFAGAFQPPLLSFAYQVKLCKYQKVRTTLV
jgi:hypothetical protein